LIPRAGHVSKPGWIATRGSGELYSPIEFYTNPEVGWSRRKAERLSKNSLMRPLGSFLFGFLLRFERLGQLARERDDFDAVCLVDHLVGDFAPRSFWRNLGCGVIGQRNLLCGPAACWHLEVGKDCFNRGTHSLLAQGPQHRWAKASNDVRHVSGNCITKKFAEPELEEHASVPTFDPGERSLRVPQ
jgi:hypothetical protein